MSNAAKNYHRLTSYTRHNMTPHFLDWDSRPSPFKFYSDMQGDLGVSYVTLPDITMADLPGIPLIEVYRNGATESLTTRQLTLSTLSTILSLACGLTARSRQPGGGEFFFRSAPSAGALYPNEVYLIWPETLPDVKTEGVGVFHFNPYNNQLARLRKDGDIKNMLHHALLPEAVDTSPIFFISGIFFRSAWKYRDRAYRYLLLDAGHLLESLRLAMSAIGWPTALLYDFNDDALNRLTGVDPDREVCLGGIYLSQATPHAAGSRYSPPDDGTLPAPLSRPILETSRVSDNEIQYDTILNIHRAGKHSGKQRIPSSPSIFSQIGPDIKSWMDIGDMAPAASATGAPVADYVETVLRRRSRRNFISRSLPGDHLTYILDIISLTMAAKHRGLPDPAATVACGLLTAPADDMPAGYYLLDTHHRRLGCVKQGDYRRDMTAICLDQSWLANAAAHFLLISNLNEINRYWGGRGYRYAMMTAGRLGHAIYLAATALGLGCCGIGAFYDDEACALLKLNDNSVMLYLLAVGPLKSSNNLP